VLVSPKTGPHQPGHLVPPLRVEFEQALEEAVAPRVHNRYCRQLNNNNDDDDNNNDDDNKNDNRTKE